MSAHATETDRLWTQELYREFHEILSYYRLTLPVPLIQVSDDKSRYGTYDALYRRLTISRLLITNYCWDVVIEVLKHEIAHLLLAETGAQDAEAHGQEFQLACQRLGVAPWARQAQIEIDPATAVQMHRTLSEEQERLLRKVEKLLSLASSGETHEASLAMERARELIVRHQLEKLLLHKEDEFTYILIEHRKKQISAHQASISSILCTHFFVDCVTRSMYHAQDRCHYKALEIIGTRENVQMAEYVYWFLWNQLPLLWQRHIKDKKTVQSRISQRSFYLGVLSGFHEKLSKQKIELQRQAQEWGLQISERYRLSTEGSQQRGLQVFLKSRYPHLQRRSQQGRQLTYDDYTSGQAKGRELNLHRGLDRGHSGKIQLLPGGSSRP